MSGKSAISPSRFGAVVLMTLSVLGAAVVPAHYASAQDASTSTTRPNCEAPTSPSQGQSNGAAESNQLSRKLDNCGSVLEAPKVGDGDIVTPAPSTGTGRVIEPGSLPPNANPSNGSGG